MAGGRVINGNTQMKIIVWRENLAHAAPILGHPMHETVTVSAVSSGTVVTAPHKNIPTVNLLVSYMCVRRFLKFRLAVAVFAEPGLGLGKLGSCPEACTIRGPPRMSCHLLFFFVF